MTSFDVLVVAILALSTGFAVIRGGLREVGTLAALAIAAALAILLAKPLLAATGAGASFMATGALAGLIGVLAFCGLYFLLHLGLKRIELKGGALRADRIGGGVFGFLRGLALVGLGFLAYGYYLDADRRPESVTKALTLPVAQAAANFFGALAPEGNRLAPSTGAAPETNAAVEGYARGERSALAEIVTTATTSADATAVSAEDAIAKKLTESDPK